MKSPLIKLAMLATFVAGPLLVPCGGQVTLVWNPSSSSGVAGYNLCWGTSSGVYTFTNTYPSAQTNATITNLAVNGVYYFAAQSFWSNGTPGPFSNEACVTNLPPPLQPVFVATTNTSQTTGSVISGNGGGIVSINGPLTNSSANFWGVPPFLTMTVSNGEPSLNIGGTVGATLKIQSTANPSFSESWVTITNVTMTNLASVAQDAKTSQSQDLLDLAFVPAAQALPISSSQSTPFQIFRVVMPYDYVILASIVLKGQGYTPRLILVNMPGIVHDDACYVNESTSFIHYDWANSTLQLEGSGASIRQIANTLANSLKLDWTSASEFTYSNGLGQLLATVVETEPPSSDPVPGQVPPSPPMVIDF
jgi:hypothetical protein